MTMASNLLRHMVKFYSDGEIARDVEAVIGCCGNEADRNVIRAYAGLRRTASGYSPGSYRTSNHGAISPLALALLGA